jgi:16S rRNA (cytosine1402-N4)-methyltransferase
MPRQIRHIPVLLDAVLESLDPRPGQTIIDCTTGLAGHSVELLTLIRPDGLLIGLDFDPRNLELARQKLETTGGAFRLIHSNFAAIPTVLAELKIAKVDGILADLGVASPQIDDPERGFSYRKPGPLDMRMDPTRGQPASALIQRLSEKELREAFLELGDETDAPQIAKLIVQRRARQPILTTQDLMAIICEARDFTLVRAAGAKLHPAARTFQALRMLVNRETGNLERLLVIAPDHLKPGGRLVIISFHSGEDRRVKAALREGERAGVYEQVSPQPVTATQEEIIENPRSRSAKLRWAVRNAEE